MSRRQKPREEAYAVVRVDLPLTETALGDSITVKEVVSSRELAEQEVARLSALNAGKGCFYFFTSTRLFPPGESAGSSCS